MTNEVNNGQIALSGRGYVNKPAGGGYQPGEFSTLLNCEITGENSIKKRPGIKIPGDGIAQKNPRKFLGRLGYYAVIGGNYRDAGTSLPGGYINGIAAAADRYIGDRVVFNTPDIENSKIYNPDGSLWLDGATTAAKIFKVSVPDGFFRYNNKNYYLHSGIIDTVGPNPVKNSAVVTISRTLTTVTDKDLDELPSASNLAASNQFEMKFINDVDVTIDAANFAAGKGSVLPLHPVGLGSSPAYGLPVLNHFIHKDRVWVVLANRLIFSKPTDPWEWRVSQDGGFVSMADAAIQYALPKDDGVYIFSKNTIDYFTYQSSPNTDGQMTRISAHMGADWACEHQGTIYFIKHGSLFQIRGTVVYKVMDLPLNIDDIVGMWYKIGSYYDYLVVQACVWRNFLETSGSLDTRNWRYNNAYGAYAADYRESIYTTYSIFPTDDPASYRNPTSTFLINTDNGAIQQLSWDALKVASPGDSAIADFFVVNANNSLGEAQLFFLSRQDNPGSGADRYGVVGAMDAPTLLSTDSVVATASLDQYVQAYQDTAPSFWCSPCFSEFVIRNYAPDGAEFNFKKYRNFLINLTNYVNPLKIDFRVDDNPNSTSFQVGPTTSQAPPEAFRLGVNQRGRAISLAVNDLYAPIAGTTGAPGQKWEIFDMRFYWTYTGRGPARRA